MRSGWLDGRLRNTPHGRFRLYDDVTLHRRPILKRLRRGDAAQYIDRIFSGTGSVQQQEASHNAEIFIKAVHAVDTILTCHCPIAMSDKRSSQRVNKHERGGKKCKRANGRPRMPPEVP